MRLNAYNGLLSLWEITTNLNPKVTQCVRPRGYDNQKGKSFVKRVRRAVQTNLNSKKNRTLITKARKQHPRSAIERTTHLGGLMDTVKQLYK